MPNRVCPLHQSKALLNLLPTMREGVWCRGVWAERALAISVEQELEVVPPCGRDCLIPQGNYALIGAKANCLYDGVKIAVRIAPRFGGQGRNQFSIKAEHPGRNWPGGQPDFNIGEGSAPSIVEGREFSEVP